MTILAYDRTGSVRTFDEYGRLRIEITPISKANICEYLGREIPAYQELGLEPERKYALLRDPVELERASDTFNSLPVLDNHTPTSADDHPREVTVGSTMDNARFEAPYLKVGMVIFDGPMIERIKDGSQREISCGYGYVADMTPGTYEGQPYDGRMTNIRGNHVALVDKGRAGPDVLVYDNANKEITVDPKEKTACDNGEGLEPIVEALRPFMGDQSDDAIRARVSELIERGNEETDKPGSANDDETPLEDDRLTKMEEYMRQEGFSPEEAAKCREMCAQMLKGEARDEDDNSGSSPDDDSAEDEEDEREKERRREMATDAAIKKALAADRALRRATEDARQMVRPLVGEVIGMDSAVQVYRYALKHTGMAMDSLRGVNEAGLKALVSSKISAVMPTRRPMAMDSASKGYTAPRKL